MKTLNQLKKTDNPSVMLFGAPFTGKTKLASQLAEHFKLIFIDMEQGKDVMFTLPEEWQKNITYVGLRDTSSYPIAIETCLKLVKMPVQICELHGKVSCPRCKIEYSKKIKEVEQDQQDLLYNDYFTDLDLNSLPDDHIVVFDSATQLTSSAIANIVKNEEDMYKLQLDDWGGLSKLMDIFFSHIQNASYKRIVISHVKEAKQDDGKMLLSPVAGSQNFSSNVARFFDHVVYLERKNKKHMVGSSTTYSTRAMTGSRTDVALEDMNVATLLAIFKPEAVHDTPVPSTVAKNNPTASKSTAEMLARLKKGS